MIDWDDLPEPDDMGFAEPADPPGAYIDGRWVDVEDLPVG